MAAVKAKPTSKLKAGKKKPLNKWIIIGGVAAVAIIGALVVRFSSASTAFSIYHSSTVTTLGVASSTRTTSVNLQPDRNYRFCVKGFSNGASSNIRLSFNKENAPFRTGVALSTKKYNKTSAPHCSATFHTTSSYRVTGNAEYASGSSLTVQSMSIDEIR